MDMARETNRNPAIRSILAILCCLNLLCSIPLIVGGIWLASRHHIICLRFLEGPIIFIGLALFSISILGLVGFAKQKKTLIYIYYIVALLLLLLLLSFTLFAYFVSAGGGGHNVQMDTWKEYQINDYSQWLQDQTLDTSKWRGLKLCLQDREVCVGLDQDYPTERGFENATLTPVQSGCCKPPTACGFTFVNPTQWINITSVPSISDCARWNNDRSYLCYNCNSCKAGLLEYVTKDWRQVAHICLAILVVSFLVYFITCVVSLQSHRYAHNIEGFTQRPA